MTSRSPIPLRPDYSARRATGLPLVRAAAAHLIAHLENGYASDTAERLWPRDADTKLVAKAASIPATVSTSAWASTFAETALADFVISMGPASAAAALLARGLQLNFDSRAAIMVPGILSAAANVGFVQEGAPIPVRQFSIAGPTLSPRKFAVISTFLSTIFDYSTPTIESLVRDVLTQSVGLALDAALLDANAGDATRPPGLRNGISALTASTDPVRAEAMAADIAALVNAVAGVAGSAGALTFVAAPAQAAALRLWAPNTFRYEVLASSGLASGVVICIAPNALVSAVDPAPRFEISKEATLHLDTAPLPIGSPGSPATVAAPTENLFQLDAVGLRMIMQVAWALRNAGGLAWLQTTRW
jgi:hypothetical protein